MDMVPRSYYAFKTVSGDTVWPPKLPVRFTIGPACVSGTVCLGHLQCAWKTNRERGEKNIDSVYTLQQSNRSKRFLVSSTKDESNRDS